MAVGEGGGSHLHLSSDVLLPPARLPLFLSQSCPCPGQTGSPGPADKDRGAANSHFYPRAAKNVTNVHFSSIRHSDISYPLSCVPRRQVQSFSYFPRGSSLCIR